MVEGWSFGKRESEWMSSKSKDVLGMDSELTNDEKGEEKCENGMAGRVGRRGVHTLRMSSLSIGRSPSVVGAKTASLASSSNASAPPSRRVRAAWTETIMLELLLMDFVSSSALVFPFAF